MLSLLKRIFDFFKFVFVLNIQTSTTDKLKTKTRHTIHIRNSLLLNLPGFVCSLLTWNFPPQAFQQPARVKQYNYIWYPAIQSLYVHVTFLNPYTLSSKLSVSKNLCTLTKELSITFIQLVGDWISNLCPSSSKSLRPYQGKDTEIFVFHITIHRFSLSPQSWLATRAVQGNS